MNNKKSNIRHITLAGLLLAVGIVLPKFFHMIGAGAGSVFLPLFYGVAIAALILPVKYSVAVAFLTPIISYFISGMPPVPIIFFMIIELVSYAIFVHVLHKKLSPVISIALGLILSRTVYILSIIIAVKLLHLPVPFVSVYALIAGIATSIPGIIIQIVVVPLIYFIYQKRGVNE